MFSDKIKKAREEEQRRKAPKLADAVSEPELLKFSTRLTLAFFDADVKCVGDDRVDVSFRVPDVYGGKYLMEPYYPVIRAFVDGQAGDVGGRLLRGFSVQSVDPDTEHGTGTGGHLLVEFAVRMRE